MEIEVKERALFETGDAVEPLVQRGERLRVVPHRLGVREAVAAIVGPSTSSSTSASVRTSCTAGTG